MRWHGQSQPLVYFDFDGTLHPKCCLWRATGAYLDAAGGHKLFEHALLLENILGEYPSVRLVLDSLWVEKLGVNGALAHLPAKLRQRVVGTTQEASTPRHQLVQLSRAERILLDVERRRPSGWLALQPDREGWPESAMAHLLKTDPEQGIAPVLIQGGLHSKLLSISLPSPGR